MKHPIPSRTRQLSTVALMVLRLKTWESKSLPDLIRNILDILSNVDRYKKPLPARVAVFLLHVGVVCLAAIAKSPRKVRKSFVENIVPLFNLWHHDTRRLSVLSGA